MFYKHLLFFQYYVLTLCILFCCMSTAEKGKVLRTTEVVIIMVFPPVFENGIQGDIEMGAVAISGTFCDLHFL